MNRAIKRFFSWHGGLPALTGGCLAALFTLPLLYTYAIAYLEKDYKKVEVFYVPNYLQALIHIFLPLVAFLFFCALLTLVLRRLIGPGLIRRLVVPTAPFWITIIAYLVALRQENHFFYLNLYLLLLVEVLLLIVYFLSFGIRGLVRWGARAVNSMRTGDRKSSDR